MARFSKANLVYGLRARAQRIQTLYGFTTNTGTAQLTKGNVDQTVMYGKWDELRDLAMWIENGDFPNIEPEKGD